jgi:hypothetical protein
MLETFLQKPIATNHSKCEYVIFLYIQKIMIEFFSSHGNSEDIFLMYM